MCIKLADGAALVQHSPFTWFPYGVCGVRPVSPGCCWKTHRMVRAHTSPQMSLVSGEKPASNRVMTVGLSPSILQPPPALRPIVSASLCPPGGEEVGGRQQQGGPAPSSLLCPITAQVRREPPLLAVSVQTMSPSGAVGNIRKSCRDLLL